MRPYQGGVAGNGHPAPHPPGTVIVPTSGTARYMEFWQCLEGLLVPPGTRLLTTKSAELARGLNDAVAKSIGEWVWFLGDDHTFEDDLLLRLLGHHLPAVGPLNVARIPPFQPIVLRGASPAASFLLDWDEVPTGGGLWALPHDVYTGQAGLLVRREVLDRLERPVFRIGQYQSDRLNEDFWFTQSLRNLGVPHVLDTGAVMGHLNAFAVVPTVVEDRWKLAFTYNFKPAFSAWPPAAPVAAA